VNADSVDEISGGLDMMHTRKSEAVAQQLLDAMKTLVTKYHSTVRQTGSTYPISSQAQHSSQAGPVYGEAR
jgi:hypothetical protein